ncbi:MAG: universal stress protein [Desulfocucumaceae bacterium]
MRILVPIDGSKHSMRAAEYVAGNLTVFPYLKVILLAVVSFVDATLVSESPIPAEQLTKEGMRSAGLNLGKAGALFKNKGALMEEAVLVGDPADIIIRYTRENNINKIVMGSRGLNDFKGMVLGSVSHKVLAYVDVPVTIIK